MRAQVKIEWDWLDWTPGYKWVQDIVPQLFELGLTEEQLDRCVYVIRERGVQGLRPQSKL